MSKIAGTVIYKTLDGNDIEVTTVSSKSRHGCGWDDMQFIGMVSSYVRRGKPADIWWATAICNPNKY